MPVLSGVTLMMLFSIICNDKTLLLLHLRRADTDSSSDIPTANTLQTHTSAATSKVPP